MNLQEFFNQVDSMKREVKEDGVDPTKVPVTIAVAPRAPEIHLIDEVVLIGSLTKSPRVLVVGDFEGLHRLPNKDEENHLVNFRGWRL